MFRSRPTDTLVGVDPQPPGYRRRRGVRVAAVVGVAALALAWGPWRDGPADVRDGTTSITTAELAAQHGVDVNLIAVTAAGGLVELRVQVTDPDKADAALRDPAERPALVAEDSGETLVMSNPPHHRAHLELGGQYYFLLANAHSALHKGQQVTLVIGDTRVEHLEVQG